MKISLDAGALCTKNNERFGNYTFTKNLLESLLKYDKTNEYFCYSFCEKPDWLKTNSLFHYQVLRPRTLWLSTRVSLEELRKPKSIFLALNQAIPARTGSSVISFSHGLSFYYYPQLYQDAYYALKDQLKPMLSRSRKILVSSRKVKKEFMSAFPKADNIDVLPFGIPEDMFVYTPQKREKYFVYIGMDHPIKNIEFLLNSFKIFKKDKKFADYKLVLVGNLKRYEDPVNSISIFSEYKREKVRLLLSKARGYLTASFYESFNFPVVEALAQKCQVIGLKSALIPEYKSFVATAFDGETFLKEMKEIASGKEIRINNLELKQIFSWERYVKKLSDLYD